MYIKMLAGSIIIIIWTAIFQFGTKNWLVVASVFLVLEFVSTLYIAIFVPESSLWQYGSGKYKECRKGLTKVAHYNSVYYLKGSPYEQFRFP